MLCALIQTVNYSQTEETPDFRLLVDRIIDVSTTASMIDFRKNLNYPYALPVDENVKIGMIFDPNTFTIYDNNNVQVYPPLTAQEEIDKLNNVIAELTYNVDEDKLTLDELKDYLIRKNKKNLEEYLYSHPMEYNEHTYTITLDKQTLILGSIISYKLNEELGLPEMQLTWNETGGECVPFTYQELATLMLMMGSVVKPIVSFQQHTEILIRNAETVEEAKAIDVTFDNYSIKDPTTVDSEADKDIDIKESEPTETDTDKTEDIIDETSETK